MGLPINTEPVPRHWLASKTMQPTTVWVGPVFVEEQCLPGIGLPKCDLIGDQILAPDNETARQSRGLVWWYLLAQHD